MYQYHCLSPLLMPIVVSFWLVPSYVSPQARFGTRIVCVRGLRDPYTVVWTGNRLESGLRIVHVPRNHCCLDAGQALAAVHDDRKEGREGYRLRPRYIQSCARTEGAILATRRHGDTLRDLRLYYTVIPWQMLVQVRCIVIGE